MHLKMKLDFLNFCTRSVTPDSDSAVMLVSERLTSPCGAALTHRCAVAAAATLHNRCLQRAKGWKVCDLYCSPPPGGDWDVSASRPWSSRVVLFYIPSVLLTHEMLCLTSVNILVKRNFARKETLYPAASRGKASVFLFQQMIWASGLLNFWCAIPPELQ